MKFQPLFLFLLISFFQAFSQDYYNALLIPTELKENANAVVRLDETNVTVNDYNSMSVQQKKIVTVLNKNGDRHIDTYIVYDPSYQIKKIEAVYYNALGNEIKKYKKRDFQEAAAVMESQLYQDNRVLFIHHTPTAYPYTVEFITEYTTSSTAFFPIWYPLKEFYVSTENSSFTVKNPKNIGFKSKTYLFEAFGLKETKANNEIILTAKNLKAIQYEQFIPALNKIFPKYTYALEHFQLIKTPAKVTTWEEFGHWQNRSLLNDKNQLPQKTIQEITSLISDIDDPIEKVRKIYEFMQQKTRYIGVQIGIGGWQPTSAMDVDRLSYGDCKGLTNYTKALLDSQGIESYYTIVYGNDEIIDIAEDFVALQGNHAILTVPVDGKNYFLECTSQYVPFNYTANSTDDRNVILITPQGGKIVRTPKYTAEDSYQTTTGTYKLFSNGNAEGTAIIKTGGIQYGERLFLDRATEKEKTDYYKEYWGYLHNLTLKTIAHNNDKIQVEYRQDVGFSTTGYASFAGNEMILSLNMFNRNTTLPARYSDRKLPFEIKRGFKDVDEVEIEIPEDYQITFIPEKTTLETKYGSYLCEVQKLGEHKILYKRAFILNDGHYPKEEYELFRNFMRDVIKFDQLKAILTKKM